MVVLCAVFGSGFTDEPIFIVPVINRFGSVDSDIFTIIKLLDTKFVLIADERWSESRDEIADDLAIFGVSGGASGFGELSVFGMELKIMHESDSVGGGECYDEKDDQAGFGGGKLLLAGKWGLGWFRVRIFHNSPPKKCNLG